ncbi:MAG TPA: MaoC/PaaZ C-terminal domain-containing protein [Beijerinckiaceae bacterium]|jgi:acyl dehydratase|nr:MaoC/PaaZ C-terminal domain-containing protein [Beijerinckiaceae bacterium]
MPRFAFEDFSPGNVLEYGRYAVTKDEIVAFAREFDPQPFHLDEKAAKHSLLGGLCASGWHTTAMLMRMTCDGWMLDSTAMGAPGIEEVKWLAPVRPGDVLRVRAETLGTRVSKSRPEMGLVLAEMHVLNQTDETVMVQRNFVMLGRRDASAVPVYAPETHAEAPTQPSAEAAAPAEKSSDAYGWYESVAIGDTLALGACHFRREDMLRFARAYDPQPFHLDDAAAKASHFGALAASGWHTGAAFMQRLVATKQRLRDEARARGEDPPEAGPSPGFHNLKWLRPVYVDDRLSFTTTPIAKRPIARPGWGLVMSRCTGVNQDGLMALDCVAAALVPMRG